MTGSLPLSALAGAVLLTTATVASAQQSQAPQYVDVGRDFRQADRVTMGSDLLTPDEHARFDSMRKQAKTRADRNRVEDQEAALLNQRVNERINAALNQPIQSPNTAERPDAYMPGSSGMGSGTR